MMLLRGFIKMPQKSPPREIELALRRKQRWSDEQPAYRTGSSLDAFLAEEGLLEEATEHAIKRVLAWQIEQQMKAGKLTEAAMAKPVETSRTQLDRLLDPKNSSVIRHTLQRAAAVLGKRLRLELV